MRALKDHLILIVGSVFMAGPLVWVLGGAVFDGGAWQALARRDDLDLARMTRVSLVAAGGIAALTTGVAFLAAYALVFLKSAIARAVFWATLATLYFPIEARMLPTFDVISTLGLVNRLGGLILPVLPMALGTLVFRQHFRSFPGDVIEAARLDGAGPLKVLVDIVLPLSAAPIAAVFVLSFMIGWNQYLWPILAALDGSTATLVRALGQVGGDGARALAVLASMPPLICGVLALWLGLRITVPR
ncbi:MAG: carbohydrate ABC transporter permease [Pseudomonadota bacterium]